MSKNENLHVIQELSQVIKELDHDRVSWVDKHFVIDLSQKAQVLLESVSRLENEEKEAAIVAAKAFLTEVAPVIQELNKQKIGA
jgi:capsule polysaccharide export protein KpsE/RkpR